MCCLRSENRWTLGYLLSAIEIVIGVGYEMEMEIEVQLKLELN